MKVIHIITHFSIGGAENVVKTLCTAGKRKDYEQYVIGFRKADDNVYESKFKNELKRKGIEVIGLNGKSDVRRFFSLLAYIKKIKPDLIHTHTEIPDFFGSLASLFFPKVILCRTIHNTVLWPKHKILGFISNYIFQEKGKATICVSESVKKTFTAKFYRHKNIITIENPINFIDLAYPVNNNSLKKEYTLLLIGRLTYQKNFELAIHALNLINKKTNLKFKCLIAGEGEEKEKLIQTVNELGLKKICKFVGFVKIDEILKISDLVISSSIFEGLPLTIIESLSAGVPVIASDIPPHQEIVGKCQYGELFKSGNVEDLANKILESLTYYNEKKQKAIEASKMVRERFNPSSQFIKYYNVHKSIINNS
ncbi:MAG: glycosyltransferase [Weizmannia coagulans]|jgi:glycosyltransferase involved in cell wall biosynthesis|uniref:glycosyltransferase n=1 Tax=Heyndrickxia coagulans TaxID=1398 RepID=UPI001459C912|nr:glycosyltransferase [Heyndrickxia coagulans]MCI1575006.1 glycosyltransferase [Heyndrickxia coagulans]NMH84000.1 glycosyltransferase [Heyndrickxia coagulans]